MPKKGWTHPHKGRFTPNRYWLLPDGRTVLLYLSKGQVALIDAVDLPKALTKRWYADVKPNGIYVRHKMKRGVCVTLSRFLLDAPPELYVDHENNNPLDNRRANLRLTTQSLNLANQRVQQVVKSSRWKGVSFDRHRQTWCAYVSYQGHRRFYQRGFATEDDAARAYNAKARELFGDYAHLNAVDA